MKWSLQLSGDEHDLRALPRLFVSDGCRVYQDLRHSQYVLTSNKFAADAMADVVFDVGRRLLRIVNGVASMAIEDWSPVLPGALWGEDSSGKRISFGRISASIRIRAKVQPTILGSDGKVRESNVSVEADRLIAAAWSDPTTEKLLRLHGDTPHSWTDLSRMLEVVAERTPTAIENLGWASAKELRRFRHTANSVAILGDEARHGKESTAPPKKPMHRGEAQALIHRLVQRSLAHDGPPARD